MGRNQGTFGNLVLLDCFQSFVQFFGAFIVFIDLLLFAADYRNEAEVGEALAEAFSTGLVKREDLFITTKASFIAKL